MLQRAILLFQGGLIRAFFLLKPGVEMFVGTYDHFVPLSGRKRGLFFASGFAFWQGNGYEH